MNDPNTPSVDADEAVVRPSGARALVPAPKVVARRSTGRGSVPIGTQLEQLRRRLGYSVAAVAREVWITETALDGYESGFREPPPDVVERLADFYRIQPDQLGGSHVAGADSEQLWIGWAELDFSTSSSNAERLLILSNTIRSFRGLSEQAPVSLRDDELGMVAAHLSLDDPGLSADIEHSFQLDKVSAEQLRARLVHAAEPVKPLPSTSTGPIAES